MSVYTAVLRWEFWCADEAWSLERHRLYFEVCETRKNGQEDTHGRGDVILSDSTGKYEWLEEPYTICQYSGTKTADALLAFFNTHGTPWSPR